MSVKEKIKQTQGTIKNHFDYLKKDSISEENSSVKKDCLHKNAFNGHSCSKKGNEQEFFEEFYKITREGYRMMLSDQVPDPVPGINVILGYVFFSKITNS